MMSNSKADGGQPKGDRLEIYTLGRFQVCCGEQKLFAETGRSPKTEELFMYLITHRWKAATPEIILETLWPEREYADPKNTLKNLIYRLKQKLETHRVPGARHAITSTYGCYGWNNTIPFWLDAEAFETLCQEARSLAETDPLRATARYREALALYRGDYLSHWHYSDWVLPARQYYRRLFVKSVTELLALEKEHRLFSQMVEDAEKALSIEHLDEKFHLLYLEALLEEGLIEQARTHYEHITSLLYRELGAKPSPDMQRIYRDIKKRSEKTGPEYSDVQEMLKERELAEGAMHCDPETFHFLCRLARRQAERGSLPVQLGLLSFTGPDFQLPPSAPLQGAMDRLQKVLQAGLRKGDVFSQLNENQFALLLPGPNLEQAQNVLKRLKRKYEEAYPQEELILRSSTHPVLPWE